MTVKPLLHPRAPVSIRMPSFRKSWIVRLTVVSPSSVCRWIVPLSAQPEDDMSEAERSFYDALAENESAVEVMDKDQLKVIASELVRSFRENSGVDWWQRDDVRAKMRVAVKRILRRYGYPPDLQAKAVKLVIKQAEAMARRF